MSNVVKNSVLAAALLAGTAFPAFADGEVNIYSYRQPDLIKPVLDAFTKETGIKTNVLFLDKGLVERIKAEGENSPADVIMTVDIARLTEAKEGGVVQPLKDAKIDANEAMTVASAAVSDARGFCERQPDACLTGGKVAVALGQRAEAGARTLYQFISERLSDKSTDTEKTAQLDKPAAKVVPVSDQARGTLTRNDLQPAWHAPVPLPPKRSRPAV